MEEYPPKAGDMEEYSQKAGDLDFQKCWDRINCFATLRIALSAVIGGLLLGFNTGVISSALPYIRGYSGSVTENPWSQAFIVSATAAGALLGLPVVGWVNDRLGLKMSLILADVLSIIGIITSALAISPLVLVIARIFVGLTVGMTFITLPLYVSEAFSARYLGVLFCTNSLLITVGQFFSNVISLAYTEETYTWRWMVGIAIYPSFINLLLLLSLHECPKWYFQKGDIMWSDLVIQFTYSTYREVEEATHVMDLSIGAEKPVGGSLLDGNVFTKIREVPRNELRLLLFRHMALQAAQHLVGSSVMIYYGSTIIQMAGTTSNETAVKLSLIPSGLNAVASIVSMLFVDRYRRKRMMTSLFGTFTCLLLLSGVFHAASTNEMTCLKDVARNACPAADSLLEPNQYPIGDGMLVAVLLGAYVIFYSIGLGTIPLICRSKMHPLRYRGIRIGVTSALDWLWNFILSLLFFFFIDRLGSAGTFLLFAGFSLIGLVLYWRVPDTEDDDCQKLKDTRKS